MRDPRAGLLKHFEPLGIEFGKEKRRARHIGLRFSEVRHDTGRDRVAADGHHDRDGRGRLLRRASPGRSMRDEEINPRSNKLSDQLWKPVVPSFCPAKLDSNVPVLNVAEFTKTRSEHLDSV